MIDKRQDRWQAQKELAMAGMLILVVMAVLQLLPVFQTEEKPEPMKTTLFSPHIRVLLKQSEDVYHKKAVLLSDTGMHISYVSRETGKLVTSVYAAEERVEFTDNSSVWDETEDAVLYIKPVLKNGRIRLVTTADWENMPAYKGTFELCRQQDGLLVINEIPLEEYLCTVVPSEMPAGYPEEALKSQAVCARTYAYRYYLNPGLPQYGAHVDDTVSYQVYNRIEEQPETTKAIQNTMGELLYYEGSPANTYYYSTSCGYGTDTYIWKNNSKEAPAYIQAKAVCPEEISCYNGTTDGFDNRRYSQEEMKQEANFTDFITGVNPTDFEREESWYRWQYYVEEIDIAAMEQVLKNRWESNPKLILTKNKQGQYISRPINTLGELQKIRIERRNPGGVVDELVLKGTEAEIKVISEYNVRAVLSQENGRLIRQDETESKAGSLLPSAFFIIKPSQDGEDMIGYTLTGGGFGHGAGMSQNGAKAMANAGYGYEEILQFFYHGCELKQMTEQ